MLPTFHPVLDIAVLGPLCVGGCVANILAFFILHQQTTVKSTITYLQSLALTDTAFLLYLFIQKVLPACLALAGDHTASVLISQDVYTWLWPVGCMLQMMSTLLVAALTLDRYLAICHPFQMIKWSTVSRVRWTVVVMVVVSVAFHVPRFFHNYSLESKTLMLNNTSINTTTFRSTSRMVNKATPVYSESGNQVDSDYHTILQDKDNHTIHLEVYINLSAGEIHYFGSEECYQHKDDGEQILGCNKYFQYIYYMSLTWLLMYLCPLCLLIGLNIKLIQSVRRATSRYRKLIQSVRRATSRYRSPPSTRAATINVIAIVTVFLVCQTPDFVQVVVTQGQLHASTTLSSAICLCFLALNSAVNFIIYVMFYPRFRERALRVICSCCRTQAEQKECKKIAQKKLL